MPTPLIRNGRLVGEPLGKNYDVNKLTPKELQDAKAVLEKNAQGKLLTAADATDLLKARKAARASRPRQDPMDSLSDAINGFKQACKGGR